MATGGRLKLNRERTADTAACGPKTVLTTTTEVPGHDGPTTTAGAASEPRRREDLVRMRRVRDRMDREYAKPLDVEALARSEFMSAGHLSRLFRGAYGESPYSYLMTRRVERAMALLRRGNLSVTEVCFAVGCGSLGTFTTRFTELVGLPPAAYRKRGMGSLTGLPPCVIRAATRPARNRGAPLAQSQ